ncbi:MAG TPA: helix-turn-helix domain-containing protein, partial [Cellvibrionaceae bacterium]|nr:helix-turn-helix domain-containing protein [Cellvibrionaceae bacterium]
NSMSDLAEALGRGKADVSRSIARLLSAGLLGERDPGEGDLLAQNRKYYSVQRQGLSDLLIYGVRYVFAPRILGFGRGVATGWNCPWVRSAINPPDVPLVWPTPGGESRGQWLEPLYPGVPTAAERDQDLYALLALIEVLRIGKPRELKYAQEMVYERVMDLHQ